MFGSSPRPWGMPGRRGHPRRQERFIPTPVGNAVRRAFSSSVVTVHPHARGECISFGSTRHMRYGSSPRPWGMHRFDYQNGEMTRFIPTPVGNAESKIPRRLCYAVHPHARGECARYSYFDTLPCGSSPRPWGMHTKSNITASQVRFIPTPVGNAHSRCHLSLVGTVHPHARGECGHGPGQDRLRHGSSPRPWGMRTMSDVINACARFIPTPVGNALPLIPCCYINLGGS